MSYLKFRSFDGAPLKYHSQYDAARLASFGNRNFHISNIPHGIYTYLGHANFHFEPRFPWLYLRTVTPGRHFPSAKHDVQDHTLALPYAMPGLFALALAGSAWAAVVSRAARTAVVLIWTAASPVVLALFAAVSIAHRYTADFLPFIVCASAFGLTALDNVRRGWREIAVAGLAATLWSVALTLAITLHYQREADWGVPNEVRQNYQQLRAQVDHFFGRPQGR
jgi:hypothetical protein